MIQAVLFPVFNYIANNKWAQIVVGLGVGFIAYRIWLAGHDQRVKKVALKKSHEAARKAQTKALNEIEEEANDRVEKAKQARASVPDTDVLDSMSESEYEFLFGRKRNG